MDSLRTKQRAIAKSHLKSLSPYPLMCEILVY